MSHLGFTGTRHGMTQAQGRRLATILKEYEWLHHGDCIGADAEAHEIAKLLNRRIHVHPPEASKYRAYKHGDVMAEPAPYTERDRHIVSASDLLVGCPRQETGYGVPYSGTWYTINYARKLSLPVKIIRPSGLMETFS